MSELGPLLGLVGIIRPAAGVDLYVWRVGLLAGEESLSVAVVGDAARREVPQTTSFPIYPARKLRQAA